MNVVVVFPTPPFEWAIATTIGSSADRSERLIRRIVDAVRRAVSLCALLNNITNSGGGASLRSRHDPISRAVVCNKPRLYCRGGGQAGGAGAGFQPRGRGAGVARPRRP